MFIGLVLLLVLNLPLAPVWAKLLRIPRPYLYAGILFFASIGAYAVSGQPFDLVVLLVIGAIGFGMRRYGLPVLPAVLGVILGPDAELQLRRSLQIADGDPLTLFSTPFAITVYVVMLAVLVVPAIRALRARRAPAEDRTEEPLAR
jgi:putative tricarboxylic transport membrane protein